MRTNNDDDDDDDEILLTLPLSAGRHQIMHVVGQYYIFDIITNFVGMDEMTKWK